MLKFIKSPGHLSNSGVFQDFQGPWLQWANTYKSLPHSSSEPPLEYNQVKPISKNYDFFNQIKSYWNIMLSHINSREERRWTDTFKVRVRKKDFSKHFSDAEDKTLIVIKLNRGSIVDLSLPRTLLAICQVVRATFLGVILIFY